MLSTAQKSALEQRLRALQAELAATLAVDADTAPVAPDRAIGRLTRLDAMQQQAMAKANRRDLELRLRQIAAALEAFANDEYGECQRCEEPIAYARLQARPEARICLPCQELLEKRR